MIQVTCNIKSKKTKKTKQKQKKQKQKQNETKQNESTYWLAFLGRTG